METPIFPIPSFRSLFFRPWQFFIVLLAFVVNTFGPMPVAQADEFRLPAPGVMVRLSPPLDPPILKGIKVHPDNPFRFDFILDKGDPSVIPAQAGIQNQEQLKTEATRLIKYFLASLTIPEKDLWVNLSPYEKDRIIPQSFGLTEMGRDLLAEDYILKQITASLIYPEDEIGKKFWKRIYEEAAKKFGTTNIPVNTFNKVWIVPDKAVVYENAKAGTAYVVESKLKVMLEQDYLALEKNTSVSLRGSEALGSQIVREIVLPELTKEVNEDKNFAQLRQIYNSLILATWYKKKIKDSILSQVYADKNKTAGVQYISTVIPAKAGIQFKNDVEGLYQEYLKAFKKGVYNYIKEEQDPATQEVVPRKYFSGGVQFAGLTWKTDGAMSTVTTLSSQDLNALSSKDKAMRVEVIVEPFKTGLRQVKEKTQKIIKKYLPIRLQKKWTELESQVSSMQMYALLDSMKQHGFSSAEIKRFYFDVIDHLPTAEGKKYAIAMMYDIVVTKHERPHWQQQREDFWKMMDQFEPKVREYVKEFLFFKMPLEGTKQDYYHVSDQAESKDYQKIAAKANIPPQQVMEFLVDRYYKIYHYSVSNEILMMLKMGMSLSEIKEYLLKDIPSLYGSDQGYAFAQLREYIQNNAPEERQRLVDDEFLLVDFILYYPSQGEGYEEYFRHAEREKVIDRLTESGFFERLKEITGLDEKAVERIGWLIALTTHFNLHYRKTDYLETIYQRAQYMLEFLKPGVLSDFKQLGLSPEQTLRLALKISTRLTDGARDEGEAHDNIIKAAKLIHYAALMPQFKEMVKQTGQKPEIALHLIFTRLLLGSNFDRRGVQGVEFFVKVMNTLLTNGLTLTEIMKVMGKTAQWTLSEHFIMLDKAFNDKEISDFIAQSKDPKQAVMFIMNNLSDWRNRELLKELKSNVIAVSKLFSPDQFSLIIDVLAQEEWRDEEIKLKESFLKDLVENKRIGFLRQQGVADEDIVLFIKTQLETQNPYALPQRRYIWNFINSITRINVVGMLRKRTDAQNRKSISKGLFMTETFEDSLNLFTSFFPSVGNFSQETISEAVVSILENMVETADNIIVRQAALRQLGKSKEPKAFDFLIGRLSKNNPPSENLLILEKLNNFQFARPVQCPPFLNFLKNLLDQPDYYRRQDVITNLMLHLSQEKHVRFLNKEDILLSKRVIELNTAGFPIVNILLDSPLTVSQLSQESRRVRGGGMDINNDLDVALNYSNFISDINASGSDRKTSFSDFMSMIKRIRRDNVLSFEIPPEDQVQIRGLVYESYQLWKQILAVQKHAEFLGRPVIVVENLSYGAVALAPITEQRNGSGKKYIIGTQIPVISTKIGSTGSHNNEFVLRQDLFTDEQIRNIRDQQPVVIVVDGTTSVSDPNRTSPHMPDAFKGYRNYFMAYNMAFTGNINPENFYEDEEFVRGLENNGDFKALVAKLKGFIPQSMDKLQPYQLKFWYPGRKDLYLRVNKQKDMVTPKMRSVREVAGPTVIFVQSGMEPESIPETIKNDFIKGGHEPAYFDDKEHYKSFYMDYKPGFGIVYSKKYTDFSREKFFDLLGLLKESIPKREEAPAVLISRDIDVVALDLDGTIAELNQKPSQKIIDQLIQIIKTDKKVVILTDDLEDSVDRRLEDLVKAIPGDFKSNLTVFSDSATKGYTFRGDGTKVYLTGYNQKSLLGEDTKNAVSNLVSDIFKEQLDLEKRSERLSTGRMDLRVRDGSDRTKVMVSLRQELTRKGIQVKVYKAGSKGIRIVRQHKEHALEWFLNSRDISSEKVLIMADAVKENQIDAELLSQFRQAVSINVGRDSRSLAKRNPSAVQLRPEHGGIKGAQNILQVLVRRGQIPETIAQMAVTTRQKEYAMMDRAMNTASEAKAMTRGGETGFKGDLTGEYLRIAERRLKERGVSYNNADKLRLATAMQEGLEKIPHAFSVSEPNFLAEAQKVLAPGNRSSVPFNSSAWARWLNQKIMERLSLLAPFEGLDLVPVRRVGQEKDMVGTVFRPFHKLVFHERMLRGDSARLQWVLVHEAMHFLFPGLRESYLNEAVTELMTEIVLGRDGSKGFIYANRLQVLKYVLSLDETGRVQKALLESYKTGDISLLRKENIVFFLLLTHLELFELEGRMVKGYGTGVMFKFLSEYHALIKKYNELSITGDPYAYVLSHAIGRFASEIMALNDHKSAFVFGTETVKNLPSLKSFGINPKILGLDDKAMAGERSVIGILENLRKSLSKSEGKEISVSAFAKRIGISYYYYSKFIDDEKAPGFSDIVEITKNLELTPKQKKELFLQWFKEHPGYAANELSKVLMVERLSLDLSREELAKKTGLTRVAIFNYETKGAIPSQEHCKKLAKALGLKNDELIRLGRDIIMQREIDKNDTSLAADIKKARISRGLKQREIAEKTGISKAYFGTIERGLAIPSIEITLKLAKQLGLNKEELSQKRNNEKAFRDRAMAVKTISSQDVKSVMRDHDVFVIHSIAPDSVPGENSLLTYNVSWEEKLQILLAFDPMVSASTIKEGDTVLNMWSPMGVVLKGGHILSANPIDGGTVAESIGARANARVYDKNISVSIGRAIRERKRDFYNELTVSSPEVAGIYVTHQRRVGPVSIKKTPPIDRDIRKVAEKFGITVFVLENGNLYRSHFDENRGLFVAEGEPLSKEQIIQQSFSMDSQKRQALKQDLVGHYPFRIQPKEFSFFQGWRLGREVYLLSSLRMAPDKVIKKAMSTGSNKDGEIILNDFFTGIDGKNGLSWRSQYYLKDGKVYRRKINRRGVIVASSPLDPYKNNVPEALFSNAIWHDNQGWSHQQRLDALEADIKIVIDRISKSKEQEGRERAVELQQDYLSRLVFFAYGYGEYADEIGDTTTSERAFAIARSVISEEKYRHFKQARVKEDNSFRYTVGDFKLLEDINPSSNPAMSVPEVKQKDLGGIDFNSNKIDLQVKNQGEGIQFKMDPAMLAQLQNASGFTPVIINIQPMNNLREFLGIDA